MALKLYEYPEAYRDLWNRIEGDGDGSADTAESLSDATREEFDNLEGEYTYKVENIA